jgi:hypothetical protein
MDDRRKVVREIEPLDEDELIADLKFLYHNRTDTVDLFIEEAIPLIKYHINEVMVKYQDRLMDDLTNSLKGEIAGVILRTRRETIYNAKLPTPPEVEESNEW